jgi:hypothetical protein
LGDFGRSCDGLSAAKIDALLRKWPRLLPHPVTGADRKAGHRCDISDEILALARRRRSNSACSPFQTADLVLAARFAPEA